MKFRSITKAALLVAALNVASVSFSMESFTTFQDGIAKASEEVIGQVTIQVTAEAPVENVVPATQEVANVAINVVTENAASAVSDLPVAPATPSTSGGQGTLDYAKNEVSALVSSLQNCGQAVVNVVRENPLMAVGFTAAVGLIAALKMRSATPAKEAGAKNPTEPKVPAKSASVEPAVTAAIAQLKAIDIKTCTIEQLQAAVKAVESVLSGNQSFESLKAAVNEAVTAYGKNSKVVKLNKALKLIAVIQ